MENKKTKYLLLLAIVTVWGLFGYRLYERAKPKEDYRPTASTRAEFVKKETAVDSFSLLLNYKDPFMSTFSYRKPKPLNHPTQKKTPKKIEKKPPGPPKPFPEVIYKGNLKLKTGKAVALVAIDGKNVHLKTGESYNEVMINKIYGDSISISFMKEKKTVLRARL